jgi:hypothetical protein
MSYHPNPKDTMLVVDALWTSFIPSFFEIKESAGREFLPKRIGGGLKLALIVILNVVGEPPEFHPSGGPMNPGHNNGEGTQGYYV